MALLRSLRTPMFATLFAGQTVSRVGDFLYNIALSWWVLEKTGSATAVGGVGIASVAPMLLFLLIGGVAVDRLPRIRVMIASDIGRGIAVTLMTFLAISNLLEVWHVYFITLFFGITDAFFHPAYTATVPQITPKEDLTSANSLTSMSIQLARIAGPPIGAVLIAAGGTSLAFGINAASFLSLPSFSYRYCPTIPRLSAPSTPNNRLLFLPMSAKGLAWSPNRRGYG